MKRYAVLAASVVLWTLAASALPWVGHKLQSEPVDPAKGANVASRIPCDGETNPNDEVKLVPVFSSGPLERAFRVQFFEKDYCKLFDLGFKCLRPGHDLWKEEWSVTSANLHEDTLSLAACNEWQSKAPPQYVITGWYLDPLDPKPVWKQAQVTKAASRWETYEFADPRGGTAQLEIDRR